jgi:hypothetical protein
VGYAGYPLLEGWPQSPERLPMAEKKGNPGGRKARAKSDPGRKSTSRERIGQAGSFGNENIGTEEHRAGDGGRDQQAGGSEHHGGDAREDRNP